MLTLSYISIAIPCDLTTKTKPIYVIIHIVHVMWNKIEHTNQNNRLNSTSEKNSTI